MFREDLYYRLNIIKIHIEPLRHRTDDILPLIEHFTKEYAASYPGKEKFLPNSKMIEKLSAYHWPGNVRELQNVLKRMLVLGDHEKIIEEFTNNHFRHSNTTPSSPHPDKTGVEASIFSFLENELSDPASLSLKKIKKKVLNRVEKEVISRVLQKTDWNRSKASKILKISYKTLLNKIDELQIIPSTRNHDISE
jgi:DNA-binding NtrC family response regulator